MGRIADTFDRLRDQGRTGLITYLTAGDPTLARTRDLVPALERAGADLIEIGVPFSDPLADGPVIQRATERALAGGTTLSGVLDLVAGLRAQVQVPLVLFTYANPVARLGFGTFAGRAAAAGVDGVLALDVPIEEAGPLQTALDEAGVDTIFLLSPTTTLERIQRAAALGRGFLYGISRLGVTGAREQMASSAADLAARVRRETALPLALGFGVSNPAHVAAIGQWADAAVVGSGLVQVIADQGDQSSLVPAVESYVRWLKGGTSAPASSGPRNGIVA